MDKTFKRIQHPGILLGPAQFFDRSDAATLHRRLYAFIWSTKPIYVSLPFLCLTQTYWLVWAVWWRLLIYTTEQRKFNIPVSKWRHFCDLLTLCFWVGASPNCYGIFHLYRYPRSTWLFYVFPQEQRLWHLAQGGKDFKAAASEMSNKLDIERRLKAEGLATVKTEYCLERAAPIDEKTVFQKKSFFIKPNCANAMRGCALLSYDQTQEQYQLKGNDILGRPLYLETKINIKAHLEDLTKKHSVLFQRPLVNGKAIEQLCKTQDGLITLRAVTCRTKKTTVLVQALLEVPYLEAIENTNPPLDKEILYHNYPVDTLSGSIQRPKKLIKDMGTPIMGTICNWTEIKDLVEKAHTLFPKLKTIAWDIGLCDKEPTIIEGNSGWGILSFQVISGSPLLTSQIIDAYKH